MTNDEAKKEPNITILTSTTQKNRQRGKNNKQKEGKGWRTSVRGEG